MDIDNDSSLVLRGRDADKSRACVGILGEFYKYWSQGRRKMKKVRGALRAMKTQVLLEGPGTRPPEIYFYF